MHHSTLLPLLGALCASSVRSGPLLAAKHTDQATTPLVARDGISLVNGQIPNNKVWLPMADVETSLVNFGTPLTFTVDLYLNATCRSAVVGAWQLINGYDGSDLTWGDIQDDVTKNFESGTNSTTMVKDQLQNIGNSFRKSANDAFTNANITYNSGTTVPVNGSGNSGSGGVFYSILFYILSEPDTSVAPGAANATNGTTSTSTDTAIAPLAQVTLQLLASRGIKYSLTTLPSQPSFDSDSSFSTSSSNSTSSSGDSSLSSDPDSDRYPTDAPTILALHAYLALLSSAITTFLHTAFDPTAATAINSYLAMRTAAESGVAVQNFLKSIKPAASGAPLSSSYMDVRGALVNLGSGEVPYVSVAGGGSPQGWVEEYTFEDQMGRGGKDCKSGSSSSNVVDLGKPN